jgi:hypothetical protein
LALGGCGGGGGGGSPAPAPGPAPQASGGSSGWIAGTYLPPASFAGQCVAPRSGVDPLTNQPYADVQGTVLSENNWLRSWSNDLYLWYDEIVDRDPGLYGTAAYFDLLKTLATTISGGPKDKFHFTYATAEWLALSQSGIAAGYGIEWAFVARLPPRHIVVAYTYPGPAAAANVQRGEVVLTIDGVDVVSSNSQADVARFLAGLDPAVPGETHVFTLRHPQTSAVRTVTMQSANVTLKPVQNVKTIATSTGVVGYLQFNDHIATAEAELFAAIDTLRQASIDDLVLDLRYNGGGLLALASQLAHMIAGTVPTAGQAFESLRFNDKHTLHRSGDRPSADADAVHLDHARWAAAADVEPVGTTYFTIQFKGVNAAELRRLHGRILAEQYARSAGDARARLRSGRRFHERAWRSGRSTVRGRARAP